MSDEDEEIDGVQLTRMSLNDFMGMTAQERLVRLSVCGTVLREARKAAQSLPEGDALRPVKDADARTLDYGAAVALVPAEKLAEAIGVHTPGIVKPERAHEWYKAYGYCLPEKMADIIASLTVMGAMDRAADRAVCHVAGDKSHSEALLPEGVVSAVEAFQQSGQCSGRLVLPHRDVEAIASPVVAGTSASAGVGIEMKR